MSDRIEHYFHFSPPASLPGVGLELFGDHATLQIPAVSSFNDLIQVYGQWLGQDGYFGNSLDSFQDCLKDSKSFWSIQPCRLDLVHHALPNLPASHLEAYISILIQMVIRYHTHEEHNQKLNPVHLRQELQLNFPSMSEAQMEFYISPIPTISFRVFFPEQARDALQKILQNQHQDIQRELEHWKARGFLLPADFTR